MAKKSKSGLLGKYGRYLLMLIGIAVILMALIRVVVTKNDDGEIVSSYTGFECIFGKDLGSVNLIVISGNSKINFSFLAMLAFFLPALVAIVIGLVLPKNKLGSLVVAAAFVVGAVFCFLIPQVTSITTTTSGLLGSESTTTFADAGYGLGLGAILAGALNCVGAGVGALCFLGK